MIFIQYKKEYHDVISSQIDLNEDLDKIYNWAYQWKMSFNPDPLKKAQEVIFSRKVNNVLHPPLTFNNVDVGQIRSQKHLGMFLDFKLSFNEHLETVFCKNQQRYCYTSQTSNCVA